jgi:hypothetical protein
MTKEPINLDIEFNDAKGLIIPSSIRAKLHIEIRDGFATFQFSDPSVTKRFADVVTTLEKEKNIKSTTYNKQMNLITTIYFGETQSEIVKKISKQLEGMGMVGAK